MVCETPMDEFCEAIFSEMGTKYLKSRGLLLGDIIESSMLTSSTLLAIPNNFTSSLFQLSGMLGDISEPGDC